MKQLFIYSIVFLFTMNNNPSGKSVWTLKKDRKGIKVYTRKSGISKLHEFKAVTDVKTSMEMAIKTITDGDNLWKWNYKTSESKTIEKISDHEFVIWMENDFNWPIKDRDNVSRLKVEPIENGGYRINITPETSNIPVPVKNNIRITKFEGYWQLIPKGVHIEITQQLYGDPEGMLPHWLVNNVLTSAPYHSFSKLKELLEK